MKFFERVTSKLGKLFLVADFFSIASKLSRHILILLIGPIHIPYDRSFLNFLFRHKCCEGEGGGGGIPY